MNEILQILLVEDNPGDVDLIKERLSGALFRTKIEVVKRLSEALESIASNSIDIVVLDLGLPDSNGLETIRAVRRGTATLPIVVLTGNNDEQLGLAAIQEGAQDYLIKGQVDGGQLVRAIRYAIERKRSTEERDKLESQLHQAQKMEAVGRLAGGIAHDFNNMLSTIMGNAEMGMMKLQPTDKLYEYLNHIMFAGNRSADLTRQLLAFARKQIISPEVLDLNVTIESMLKLLRRLIGENIHLIWKPAVNLWRVEMDPTQIDQILANLMVNARDAIIDIGNLRIDTENIELDEAHHEDRYIIPAGCYIVLTVSDDGCGMDKETQSRIFEPFFTTKEVGKGTGLGLATIYGIVKQNNGFINVYSEPGKGTTFKIYLPAHDSDEDMTLATEVTQEIPNGTETVLLVEDEATVLNFSAKLIETLGYTVLTANGPIKAMQIAGEFAGPVHLLLTDMVMPEMNGRELWFKLSAMRPEMKCLFMSGYTVDVIAQDGVLEKGVQFLHKPFSRRTLAVKLREVLSA